MALIIDPFPPTVYNEKQRKRSDQVKGDLTANQGQNHKANSDWLIN